MNEEEVKKILIKVLGNSLSELHDEVDSQRHPKSEGQGKADDVMTFLLKGLRGY